MKKNQSVKKLGISCEIPLGIHLTAVAKFLFLEKLVTNLLSLMVIAPKNWKLRRYHADIVNLMGVKYICSHLLYSSSVWHTRFIALDEPPTFLGDGPTHTPFKIFKMSRT